MVINIKCIHRSYLPAMKHWIVLLLLLPLSLTVRGESPQTFSGEVLTDYALAQKCYHTVDRRDVLALENCIQQFLLISRSHPSTEQGKKALFSVARLSDEKFEVSKSEPDLQRAFQFYNEYLKTHPQDGLADDALFQIGVLRFEKEHQKERGIRAMETVIARYPAGDMVSGAKQYLHRMQTGNSRTTPKMEVTQRKAAPSAAETSKVREPIKTVVIDPGHGGEDAGAVGKRGTKESVVALQVARKLALKLKKELGLNVYLTRTKNQTLSLDERNKTANDKKGDLFISIHANANEQSNVVGVQTFYLDNATSEAAQRLATLENRIYGKKLNTQDHILRTMLQNADTDTSRGLAQLVQNHLVSGLRQNYSPVEDLKHGAALFQVLDGVQCPAVLVEMGFITNPQEEGRLTDADYQWAVADSIMKGVKEYIDRPRSKVVPAL